MSLPPITSHVRLELLAMLRGAPSGHFAKDLASALDKNPSSIAKVLQNMRQVGHILSVREGTQHAASRVRYYVIEHEATAMAAHAAGKGITWGMGRAASQAQRASGWGGSPAGADRKAQPAIRPKSVRTQVIPHNVDERFTPTHVEKFFSLPEFRTDFIGQDTWTARVYGARA